jgi:threonine dehydratase
VALAAILGGKVAVTGTTVAILSGGNVSLEKIAELAHARMP